MFEFLIKSMTCCHFRIKGMSRRFSRAPATRRFYMHYFVCFVSIVSFVVERFLSPVPAIKLMTQVTKLCTGYRLRSCRYDETSCVNSQSPEFEKCDVRVPHKINDLLSFSNKRHVTKVFKGTSNTKVLYALFCLLRVHRELRGRKVFITCPSNQTDDASYQTVHWIPAKIMPV